MADKKRSSDKIKEAEDNMWIGQRAWEERFREEEKKKALDGAAKKTEEEQERKKKKPNEYNERNN